MITRIIRSFRKWTDIQKLLSSILVLLSAVKSKGVDGFKFKSLEDFDWDRWLQRNFDFAKDLFVLPK